VDSEILFRLAANATRDGRVDIERFKSQVRQCRGQIAAIIASRTDPGIVLVLKGNRPLELRWNRRIRGRPLRLGHRIPGHRPGRGNGLARSFDPANEHGGVPTRGPSGVFHRYNSRPSPRREGEWNYDTHTSMNPSNQTMNPEESLKANTKGMLRLFVYGTLKRGFWNHDRFCRGVLAGENAVVRGRLFEARSGIPVLQVPKEDILAHENRRPLGQRGHTGVRRGRSARSLTQKNPAVPQMNATVAP